MGYMGCVVSVIRNLWDGFTFGTVNSERVVNVGVNTEADSPRGQFLQYSEQ